MRKFLKVAACGLIMAAVVTGCSKKAAEETTPAETTAGTTTEAGSEAGASEQLQMMDLSGIDNGTVTLGDYKGIEVTKTPVEVSDEEVDAAILSERESKTHLIRR